MKQNIKQKIIQATIKLIREAKGRPEDITVRDICKEAGIGLSQVNYHFQTKENLIAQCVQLLIGDVIQAYPGDQVAYAGVPAGAVMKNRLLNIMNFLYANENISRVSILTDHQSPQAGDNTAQTINSLLPTVERVCEEKHIDIAPRLLTTWMVLMMQGMFLRTQLVSDELGIDPTQESDREKMIEKYLRLFLG